MSLFRVEKEIRNKIADLLDVIESCLQYKDLKKQTEALIRLQELYDSSRLYLKFPLSQQRLDDLLGI